MKEKVKCNNCIKLKFVTKKAIFYIAVELQCNECKLLWLDLRVVFKFSFWLLYED